MTEAPEREALIASRGTRHSSAVKERIFSLFERGVPVQRISRAVRIPAKPVEMIVWHAGLTQHD